MALPRTHLKLFGRGGSMLDLGGKRVQRQLYVSQMRAVIELSRARTDRGLEVGVGKRA